MPAVQPRLAKCAAIARASAGDARQTPAQTPSNPNGNYSRAAPGWGGCCWGWGDVGGSQLQRLVVRQRLLDNGAGKAAPAGAAAGAEVIQPGAARQSCANTQPGGVGRKRLAVGAPIWSSTTVSRSRSPARPQHGVDKVLVRGRCNQLVRKISASGAISQHGLFAANAGAVHIHRAVASLPPGFAPLAREHIIGGIVHQAAIQPGRLLASRPGARALMAEGQLGLAFGRVHRGVGGGVDDQARADVVHHAGDGVRVGGDQARRGPAHAAGPAPPGCASARGPAGRGRQSAGWAGLAGSSAHRQTPGRRGPLAETIGATPSGSGQRYSAAGRSRRCSARARAGKNQWFCTAARRFR